MIANALHTNTDDVKLEATLQEFALDLMRDAVETNVTLWVDWLLHSSHCRHCGFVVLESCNPTDRIMFRDLK